MFDKVNVNNYNPYTQKGNEWDDLPEETEEIIDVSEMVYIGEWDIEFCDGNNCKDIIAVDNIYGFGQDCYCKNLKCKFI